MLALSVVSERPFRSVCESGFSKEDQLAQLVGKAPLFTSVQVGRRLIAATAETFEGESSQ